MAAKEAGALVGLLFLDRDLTHKAHLHAQGPGSYAAHVALNEFYDAVIELADKFTEAYQGCYGELLEIELMSGEDKEPLSFLRAHVDWIKTHRYMVCDREETSLQNIIDEIVGQFYTTLYKLTFLK